MSTDDDQNARLKALEDWRRVMETDVALLKTGQIQLRASLKEGFDDIKTFHSSRDEANAKAAESAAVRQHELDLLKVKAEGEESERKQKRLMRLLGYLGTALSIIGAGSGAAYWGFSGKTEAPTEAIEAPAPPEATP